MPAVAGRIVKRAPERSDTKLRFGRLPVFLAALLITILRWSGGAAAQPVQLPDRPESGIDPDLRLAVDGARASLAAGRPDEAVRSVLSVYVVSDRFSVAQRPALLADSQRLLTEAAQRLDASGQPQQATLALDAAWSIGGGTPWPLYGSRLAELAETLSKGGSRPEALYVARRALSADPSNERARKLDERLSSNRHKGAGLAMVILGSVLGGAGLVTAGYSLNYGSRDDQGDLTATSKYIGIGGIAGAVVGGGLALGGYFLLRSGRPVEKPLSPPFLPAL